MRTPQKRGCADLGARDLPAVLHDEIARPDVVQQEIAKGTNDLVAEGHRHGERVTVNIRARRSRDDGRHVTDATAVLQVTVLIDHGGEKLCPGRNISVELRDDVRIARRRLGRSHELSEDPNVLVDILAADDVGVRRIAVCVVGNGIEARTESDEASQRGVFVENQEVRDADLIEASIAGERKQAAVWVLPAKTADAPLAVVCSGKPSALQVNHLQNKHSPGPSLPTAQKPQRHGCLFPPEILVCDRD